MKPEQYNKLNTLIADYSAKTAELEKVEAGIKSIQLDVTRPVLDAHTRLKSELTDIEAKLREIADANYDALFPESTKRSHKTPFGALSYHKSTSLDFDDPEKVVLKIEAACEKELKRAKDAKEAPLFTAQQLVRVHCEPNIEGLELLDDKTLAAFGVARVHKDNFKVKPFEMKTDKPAKKLAEEVA